jgi:hypothetical protein
MRPRNFFYERSSDIQSSFSFGPCSGSTSFLTAFTPPLQHNQSTNKPKDLVFCVLRYNKLKAPIRSVNIGGLFVLEHWILPSFTTWGSDPTGASTSHHPKPHVSLSSL